MEKIFTRIPESTGTPSDEKYLDALSPIESLATQVVLGQMGVKSQIIGMKNGDRVGVRFIVDLQEFSRWQKREIKKMVDYVILKKTMEVMYPDYQNMLSIHEKFFEDISNYQESN